MTAVRRLGDGYEPHVDEDAGILTYSLPVDSGFVSAVFSFQIQPGDLDVLLGDPYRRAVLEVVAHTVLQKSMSAGGRKITQATFGDLVGSLLHSTPADLERYLDRVDTSHHLVTRVYVKEIMARRSAAKSPP
jgi:hypothetical protein